jgi:hypothetical protein
VRPVTFEDARAGVEALISERDASPVDASLSVALALQRTGSRSGLCVHQWLYFVLAASAGETGPIRPAQLPAVVHTLHERLVTARNLEAGLLREPDAVDLASLAVSNPTDPLSDTRAGPHIDAIAVQVSRAAQTLGHALLVGTTVLVRDGVGWSLASCSAHPDLIFDHAWEAFEDDDGGLVVHGQRLPDEGARVLFMSTTDQRPAGWPQRSGALSGAAQAGRHPNG